MKEDFVSTADIDLLKDKAQNYFSILDTTISTQIEYKSRIRHFFEYIKDKGISSHTYLEYKRFLEGKKTFKASTQKKYLIVAGLFLRSLYKDQVLPIDVTFDIKGIKDSRIHKKHGIDDDELLAITNYLTNLPETKETARLIALVALFAFQGLRTVEIKRLCVGDLDLVNGIAQIHGKGKDSKEPVYLHYQTTIALKHYLEKHDLKSGSLMVSYSFKNYYEGLSVNGIRFIITTMLKDLSITKSPHGFRHYYTTALIKTLDNLLLVAQFTRHKGLTQLQVYNDDLNLQKRLPAYYDTFSKHQIT